MDTLYLVIAKLAGYYLHDLESFERMVQLSVPTMLLTGFLIIPVYLFKWWLLLAPVWIPLAMCLNRLRKKKKHERDKSAAVE